MRSIETNTLVRTMVRRAYARNTPDLPALRKIEIMLNNMSRSDKRHTFVRQCDRCYKTYSILTRRVKKICPKCGGNVIWIRRKILIDEFVSPSNLPSPEDVALERCELSSFMASLPEALRKVLKLRLQGYSRREISGILDCTEGLTQRYLSHMKKLYKLGRQ